MLSINEQVLQFSRGGILYDASRLRKPVPEMFAREYWAARHALQEVAGGRNSVFFLQAEAGRWVLRHYRRGGLMAKIFRDEYVWLGERRTRAFAEWRLLAELHRRGLPVPAPVAAYYVRRGFTYRADLITAALPTSRTLAGLLTQQSSALSADQWQSIGRTIARFHLQGVHHADLNAHNILLAQDGTVYVLDFDRGRIRSRGPWEERVLARLRRSLEKIRTQRNNVTFGVREWQWLMEGYGEGQKRIADSG